MGSWTAIPQVLCVNSHDDRAELMWRLLVFFRPIAPPSRVGQLGKRPRRKGAQRLLRENFLKLEAKSCTLGTFGIVSHKIMLSLFVHIGQAIDTPNYTRSKRYVMAQANGAHWHGAHAQNTEKGRG